MRPKTKTNSLIIEHEVLMYRWKVYRMHRGWITKPSVVHFLDISRARSIEERLSSRWVVWFDARSCKEIICELKQEIKNIWLLTNWQSDRGLENVYQACRLDTQHIWINSSRENNRFILSTAFGVCEKLPYSPSIFVFALTMTRSFVGSQAWGDWRLYEHDACLTFVCRRISIKVNDENWN